MPRIAANHPTYAFFHNPYAKGAFQIDLQHFARMCRGEKIVKPRIHVNPSLATLKRICNWGGDVAVDIETAPDAKSRPWTGKDPTRALLRTIGFGHDGKGNPKKAEACSVWWATASAEIKAFIWQFLRDKSITKVFHNGWWFDIRVLRRYGMRVENVRDTRDARRATSSVSPLKLRYLASIFNYTDDWKVTEQEEADDEGQERTEDEEKDLDGKGGVWSSRDPKQLMKYNAQDCVETKVVDSGIIAEPDWQTPRVQRLYDVHTRLSQIFARMHSTGIPVDRTRLDFMVYCTQQAVQEKRDKLLQLVNLDGFAATDDHMRALIYKRHEWVKRVGGKKTYKEFRIARFGLPDPYSKKMYTDDTLETISVSEPALILLIAGGECPPELITIIDAWWELQQQKKRLGYLTSHLLTQSIGPDNRCRPGWNSCGTDTMRISCSSPNVMNMEQTIRYMFAPTRGRMFVHADKSQLELRVMEIVANDPSLKAALDTNDVYSYDATQWFPQCKGMTPKEVKTIKPKARQSCKIIHLAKNYRAKDPTVYVQALMQDRTFKFNTCRSLSSAWDRTYERTTQWWQEEEDRVMACGYSEGRILHGRRVYPAPPEPSETANYPIQRTASEMMNLELIELDERLTKEVPDAKLIIQLHDAVDVDCAEKDGEKVTRIVNEVMNREWTVEGRTRAFPIEMKYARYSERQTWQDV